MLVPLPDKTLLQILVFGTCAQDLIWEAYVIDVHIQGWAWKRWVYWNLVFEVYVYFWKGVYFLTHWCNPARLMSSLTFFCRKTRRSLLFWILLDYKVVEFLILAFGYFALSFQAWADTHHRSVSFNVVIVFGALWFWAIWNTCVQNLMLRVVLADTVRFVNGRISWI